MCGGAESPPGLSSSFSKGPCREPHTPKEDVRILTGNGRPTAHRFPSPSAYNTALNLKGENTCCLKGFAESLGTMKQNSLYNSSRRSVFCQLGIKAFFLVFVYRKHISFPFDQLAFWL